MAKVPFNTTIPEDVRDGIKALAVDGKSQGDVVTEGYRLLTAPKVDSNVEVNRWFRETWARLEEILEMLQSVPEGTTFGRGLEDVLEVQKQFNDPAGIPGISVGIPPKSAVGGFPCRCVHSGCRGSKFQGRTKLANLCDGCDEKGHRGDPRSCERCFDDMGPS